MLDKNWWLTGSVSLASLASLEAMAQEGTELIEQDLSEDEGSGLLDSVFSGGGVMVLIIALLGGAWYMNWKRGSNKPIARRHSEYKAAKAAVEHKVVANDEKQAEIQVYLEQTEVMSEEKEKEISKIVDEAAEKIKNVIAESEPKKTVERLRRENLWRTK